MCGDRLSLSRRHLMMGAGAVFAAGAFDPAIVRAEEETKPAPNAITPSEAWERLEQGNARYASGEAKEQDYSASRAAQVKDQYPIAAVLSCADSRVPPDIIFDQGVGDLFVVRDAGNVVSPNGLANMEFAIDYLRVPLIVVLGHSDCLTVLTALGVARTRRTLPGHLSGLMKAIEPAVITAHGKHPGDFLAATVEENVKLGVKQLKTKSEVIGAAIATGKVRVRGGVYDITTGAVKLV